MQFSPRLETPSFIKQFTLQLPVRLGWAATGKGQRGVNSCRKLHIKQTKRIILPRKATRRKSYLGDQCARWVYLRRRAVRGASVDYKLWNIPWRVNEHVCSPASRLSGRGDSSELRDEVKEEKLSVFTSRLRLGDVEGVCHPPGLTHEFLRLTARGPRELKVPSKKTDYCSEVWTWKRTGCSSVFIVMRFIYFTQIQ